MVSLEVTSLLIFFCVLLISIWLINKRQPINIPPGPKPWPLVGNLLLFAKEAKNKTLHYFMYGLSRKYGPIMSVYMGPQLVIFLNSYSIVKEAFVKQSQNFSNRPAKFVKQLKERGRDIGVIASNGQSWKDIRRFALLAFRDFGIGKKTTEERIKEEISVVLDLIKQYGEVPFDPGMFLPKAVSNVICSVCFGNRFSYDDARFVDLIERIKFQTNNLGLSGSAVSVFSWLRFIPFLRGSIIRRKLEENAKAIISFVDDQIETHKKDYDPNNISDFVDLYVQEEIKGNNSVSRENIRGLIRDLFMAGTDTTATSLYWAFLYMVIYPEVQEKCHKEIDEIIGSGRLPTVADRVSTPYLEATIHEIFRLTALVSFGEPHCALSEAKLNGFSIPKGTMIISNIYAIHRDPKVWENPEAFKPERWIKDGKFVRHEEIIPFSIGPRICLGENLARMEMYLFFTSFLQKFTFKPEKPNAQLDIKGTFGLVYSPSPFKIKAEER